MKNYFIRNLKKIIASILSLFSAVDSDMDEFETALSDLNSRVGILELSNDPVGDLLAGSGDVDINNSTETIVQDTDQATVTTSFSSDEATGVETITSRIVMKTGDVDYLKVVTITPVGNTDQIRSTLTEVAKS